MSAQAGVEGSRDTGEPRTVEPPATGVTVITLGQPEVGPEPGSLASSSTAETAEAAAAKPVLVAADAGSGGASSSLSLMVMTSRGRDWAELEPALSQLTGREWLLPE